MSSLPSKYARFLAFSSLFLLAASGGCASNERSQPPLLNKESIPPNEARDTKKLIELIQKKMEKDYAKPLMKRGAHAKQHGCVKGIFIVDPKLPQELQVGIFKLPQSYPVWVRFSNSSPDVQSDQSRDMRGMAIKLANVEGETLLKDATALYTQDFILLSNPVLPVGTVKNFTKLVENSVNGHLFWFFISPIDSHLRELTLFIKGTKVHHNPLDLNYWSTTPYLFGTQTVKYSVRPSSDNTKKLENSLTPKDALREIMKQQLEKQGASFDFMVQFQNNAESMPIEDASVEWSEKASVPRKVATLHLPPQSFDSEAQETACENLSFSPWHALKEHRPLGGINRARKDIYDVLSKLRHQKNKVAPFPE